MWQLSLNTWHTHAAQHSTAIITMIRTYLKLSWNNYREILAGCTSDVIHIQIQIRTNVIKIDTMLECDCTPAVRLRIESTIQFIFCYLLTMSVLIGLRIHLSTTTTATTRVMAMVTLKICLAAPYNDLQRIKCIAYGLRIRAELCLKAASFEQVDFQRKKNLKISHRITKMAR